MSRIPVMIAVLVTAAVWVGTCVVYSRLPETIPIHWNFHGQADGFAPRLPGAFMSPAVMLALLGLAFVFPRISPKRFEVDTFAATYWTVISLAVALVGYIQIMVLWDGVSGRVDMGRGFAAGLFGFLALAGNYLSKVRRNFWMGVRTPWTLASERVWNDTHRLAAKLFVAAGLGGAVLALLGSPTGVWMATAVGLVLLAALIPVIYSLVHYKRLEARGEL